MTLKYLVISASKIAYTVINKIMVFCRCLDELVLTLLILNFKCCWLRLILVLECNLSWFVIDFRFFCGPVQCFSDDAI